MFHASQFHLQNYVWQKGVNRLFFLLATGLFLYLPISYTLTLQQGPIPGQRQAVVFYSPDCEECNSAKAYLELLKQQHHWTSLTQLDSRIVENDAIRMRFDDAFRLPRTLQGYVPAIFFHNRYAIGIEQIKAALKSGRLYSATVTQTMISGFPWAGWIDCLLAGLSLLIIRPLLFGRQYYPAGSYGVLLLGITFAVSGGSKLSQPGEFLQQISTMPFAHNLPKYSASLIGACEVAMCLMLLLPCTRQLGIMLCTSTLVGFSIVVVWLFYTGYSGNCGCFPWQDRLGWSTLLRDIGLLGIGTCLLLNYKQNVGGICNQTTTGTYDTV